MTTSTYTFTALLRADQALIPSQFATAQARLYIKQNTLKDASYWLDQLTLWVLSTGIAVLAYHLWGARNFIDGFSYLVFGAVLLSALLLHLLARVTIQIAYSLGQVQTEVLTVIEAQVSLTEQGVVWQRGGLRITSSWLDIRAHAVVKDVLLLCSQDFIVMYIPKASVQETQWQALLENIKDWHSQSKTELLGLPPLKQAIDAKHQLIGSFHSKVRTVYLLLWGIATCASPWWYDHFWLTIMAWLHASM